jgi:hypothetical protein
VFLGQVAPESCVLVLDVDAGLGVIGSAMTARSERLDDLAAPVGEAGDAAIAARLPDGLDD